MQREEADGIAVSCDFCRRDWDGQEAMVEGHHGSILCLRCLEQGLREKAVGEGKYGCTLCLRFNIPETLARWSHPEQSAAPVAVVCQECLYQAAGTFSKSPHTEWEWDRKK